MVRRGMAAMILALSALAHAQESPANSAPFSHADFMQLAFLEGRWSGAGPDGTVFFEHYDFSDAMTFRSRRYPDDAFTTATDSSAVTFQDGDVVSRWGPYRWRAGELAAGKACFVPLDAPSHFCWQKTAPDRVEVVQRWTDAAGKAQSMTTTLRRVGAPAQREPHE